MIRNPLLDAELRDAIVEYMEIFGGKMTAKEQVNVAATETPAGSFDDGIKHPSYYNRGKVEVWHFIHAHRLGFFEGNVVKYVSRAGLKPGQSRLKDLMKAKEYLAELIRLEALEQVEVLQGGPSETPEARNRDGDARRGR